MAGAVPATVPPLSLVDKIESGFYAVFVILLGLGIVGYSYSRHRERRLMQDTATSKVASMAVGAVELDGVVERATETIAAPLTGEECAIVDYEVEEYRWTDDGKEWRTQDAGVVAAPFYLNDGSGRALVDPTERSTDYDVSEANRTREKYDRTRNQPSTVGPFLDEFSDEWPNSDKKRRYTQEVIPVGADAYVFGDAELSEEVTPSIEPDKDAVELVVTEDADTELFLVSDKDEAQLTEDRQYSLALGGLLGVAVFSVGLWWFLSVLGV